MKWHKVRGGISGINGLLAFILVWIRSSCLRRMHRCVSGSGSRQKYLKKHSGLNKNFYPFLKHSFKKKISSLTFLMDFYASEKNSKESILN